MKLHVIPLSPTQNGREMTLQRIVVSNTGDMLHNPSVIRKKMENRASRHCISKIIDTHDKQDRAENTSLWDSTNNGFLTGAGAIYQDTPPCMHQE